MEKCPKCGKLEPMLTVVIDANTMSKKLLCSKCARETMGPAAVGINMGGSFKKKKWWQFWKK